MLEYQRPIYVTSSATEGIACHQCVTPTKTSPLLKCHMSNPLIDKLTPFVRMSFVNWPIAPVYHCKVCGGDWKDEKNPEHTSRCALLQIAEILAVQTPEDRP